MTRNNMAATNSPNNSTLPLYGNGPYRSMSLSGGSRKPWPSFNGWPRLHTLWIIRSYSKLVLGWLLSVLVILWLQWTHQEINRGRGGIDVLIDSETVVFDRVEMVHHVMCGFDRPLWIVWLSDGNDMRIRSGGLIVRAVPPQLGMMCGYCHLGMDVVSRHC